MKIKNYFDKYGNIMVWGVFFLYLIFQYQQVFLYYDDYGYMSMTYGYDYRNSGSSNRIYNILNWVYHSYFDVNGRIFSNILLVLSANLGGLEFMRIIMPICICMVYYFIIKIIDSTTNCKSGWLRNLLILTTYGLFSIDVCKYGMYWFAAAYGYVIPVLFFLILIYIYRKPGRINCIFQFALTFILCISSEQAIAMTIIWIISNNVADFISEHKVKSKYLSLFIVSIIGCAIFIGSPASRSRLVSSGTYEKSFLGSLIQNISNMMLDIKCLGLAMQCALIFSLLYACISLLHKTGRKINILGIIYSGVIFTLNIFHGCQVVQIKQSLYISFWFILIIMLFIYGFWLCIMSDLRVALAFLSMYASMGVMVLMPYTPMRTFIPFIFLFILFGGFLFTALEGRFIKVSALVCIGALAISSVKNIATIYKGYHENVQVLTLNHSLLEQASDKIEKGMEIDCIYLYKMVNENYCGQQPYDDSISYMLFWYDNYYGIPYDTKYVFYKYPYEDEGQMISIVD